MKPPVIFGKKFSWSDLLFGVFIVLLLIPQTRKPLQVGVNRLKLLVWSPSVNAESDMLQIAAFDYQTTDLNGTVTTHRIGDGKTTLLGFWATWCGPCVAEMPSLEALYKDYGKQVNFVLVTQEESAVVQKFMAKKGLDLPVFTNASTLPESLQSTSLPTNYLIDSDGKVLIDEKGAANWDSKYVRALLNELLQ